MQQGDPLGPLLFSLVIHPLALKIQAEFPKLDLCVWDDGTIISTLMMFTRRSCCLNVMALPSVYTSM